MKNTVIELSDLTKDFGNHRGIFDVNLSVEEGEVFGYLGPNGAGKTTTIRHLMGFLRPDAGECRMFGQDCFTNAAQIGEKRGYLAGEPVFFSDLTGEQYLEFTAGLRRMKSRKRMHELMELFEISRFGPVHKMSKGMRQKLGLICAFMDEPEAVILDEPTSGLDPLMQGRFVELILEEKKKGTTILMSSHLFEEVEKTCDRAAIIREGEIADTLDMRKLAAKRKKIYTAKFTDAEAAKGFVRRLDPFGDMRTADGPGQKEAGIPGVSVIRCLENQVELTVFGPPAALLKMLSEADVADLSVRAESLEELFLQYYDTGEHGPKGENR